MNWKAKRRDETSFSHYLFWRGDAEWAYRFLAGIDTEGAGYKRIIIAPRPPSAVSNPDNKPIDWVKAEYDSVRGRITSAWKVRDGTFVLDVSIPANTTATIFLPAKQMETVTEGGVPIEQARSVKYLRHREGRVVLEVGSSAIITLHSQVSR